MIDASAPRFLDILQAEVPPTPAPEHDIKLFKHSAAMMHSKKIPSTDHRHSGNWFGGVPCRVLDRIHAYGGEPRLKEPPRRTSKAQSLAGS
jgi:hypothetical protein